MRFFAFGVLFLLSLSQAVAQEITLNCFTDDGQEASDLTIDLDAGTMIWGGSIYTIRQINETYITAYLTKLGEDIGGEVWVMNRVTGEYKRGSVYNAYPDPWDRVDIRANVYEGRCEKRQF